MDWREHYRRRLVGAEDAVSGIKSGDLIWVSVGQQVGLLVSALLGRVDDLEGVQVKIAAPLQDYGWFSEAFRGRIDVNITYSTIFSRAAIAAGMAEYTVGGFLGTHKAVDDGRTDARPIDATFISVTPPNHAGYCCLGNALWDAKTCARRATTVIAEVNDNIIRTYGDSWIHVSEIDWFVENTQPPPERNYPMPPEDPWDRPIAELVASLVNDGDTLQIGTGTTVNGIARFGVLDDKRDLGFFSELTIPGLVDLVKKGVITSKYVVTNPHKFVTTTAGNSAEDLEYINDNPFFEFHPIEYVHDPRVIAQNDNFVAINNAVTVDLTGQIGAGSIGTRIQSGTGGHFSFAYGAFLSKGGRYICVLPSTAKGGTKSRIVPWFEPPGQFVTVSRDFADIVVTEYGVARLLNKTHRQRIDELIAVAHPDFRADLRNDAQRIFG